MTSGFLKVVALEWWMVAMSVVIQDGQLEFLTGKKKVLRMACLMDVLTAHPSGHKWANQMDSLLAHHWAKTGYTTADY